jgi:hypothetical protein
VPACVRAWVRVRNKNKKLQPLKKRKKWGPEEEERPTTPDNWRRLAVDGTERYSPPLPPARPASPAPCDDDRPTDRRCDVCTTATTTPTPSSCISPSVRTVGSIVTHTYAVENTRNKRRLRFSNPTTHPPTTLLFLPPPLQPNTTSTHPSIARLFLHYRYVPLSPTSLPASLPPPGRRRYKLQHTHTNRQSAKV